MTADIELDVYQIVAPGDSIEFIATLERPFGIMFRPELNGTGSGQFSMNRHDAQATAAILQMGNLVKCRLPAAAAALEAGDDPVFSFFLETGNRDLVSTDGPGGENLTFGGRGGLSYWGNAIWLSEVYTLPWWPDCYSGPPAAGTRGVVEVQAGAGMQTGGKYRFYSVAGGVITGFTTEAVATDFCASFSSRQTYKWPAENSKRFLVHLTDGPHSGDYFAPHQDGVVETLASKATGNTTAVTLTDVGATPGAVLKYMFDEGTSGDRPVHPIPLMSVDFDATEDSGANPWATTDALAGLSANVNDQLLETLGLLLGTGVIDVDMGPDLDMHAYNAGVYGSNKEGAAFGPGVVLFKKGDGPGVGNIASALQHQVQDAPVATFAQVRGIDDVFAQVVLPDAASRIAREVGVDGNSDVIATLEAIGLSDLTQRLARGDALSFPILMGNDEDTGLYLPHPNGHFWKGDTVSLTTGALDEDYVAAAVRVTALTFSLTDAGRLKCIVDVRAGPLAITGSLGINTPEAAAVGDGNCCGCDRGEVVPGTEDPEICENAAYYGEMYGMILLDVTTGSPQMVVFGARLLAGGILGLDYVGGTLTVAVGGVIVGIPYTDQNYGSGAGAVFLLPALPAGLEVWASARLDCFIDHSGET